MIADRGETTKATILQTFAILLIKCIVLLLRAPKAENTLATVHVQVFLSILFADVNGNVLVDFNADKKGNLGHFW